MLRDRIVHHTLMPHSSGYLEMMISDYSVDSMQVSLFPIWTANIFAFFFLPRPIITTALWIITVVIHTVNAHFGGKISAIKIHDYAATRTKGAILELFIFL